MVSGKRTDPAREDLLVVDVALHPPHHLLNVRRRRHLGGPLVVLAVLPEVLELVRRLHLGARLRRAELGDGAVEEVDLVVKVHHCAPSASGLFLLSSRVSPGGYIVLFTASHSFSSSPSGSLTILRRLPPPRVASAYWRSWWLVVPPLPGARGRNWFRVRWLLEVRGASLALAGQVGHRARAGGGKRRLATSLGIARRDSAEGARGQRETNTVAIKPAIVAGDGSWVGNPFSYSICSMAQRSVGRDRGHSERSRPNKQ